MRHNRKPRPQVVPSKYCGKWIAWSNNGLTIVAAADSPKEAKDAAVALGTKRPILQYIPTPDQIRFGSFYRKDRP